MPTRTAYPARPRRGPLRSPLAAAPHSPLPEHRPGASPDRAATHAAVPDPRSVTLDEFDEYLRTVNNRDGRPYEEATINAYVDPAKALDAWMTANSLDGDFTTVDTALLAFDGHQRPVRRPRGNVDVPLAFDVADPTSARVAAARQQVHAVLLELAAVHVFDGGHLQPPVQRPVAAGLSGLTPAAIPHPHKAAVTQAATASSTHP